MRALVLMLLASCVVVHVSAPPRAPVYECAAEDGSGRTVRVKYSGDPVRLSEGLADEPGGLWSCYLAPRHAEKRVELRTGAATDGGPPTNITTIPGEVYECSDVYNFDGSQPCESVPAPGCESPNAIPLVAGPIHYDGCRWQPGDTLTPVPSSTPLAPAAQPHASAESSLLDLELAAETTNGATCTPNPWAPLNLQECR